MELLEEIGQTVKLGALCGLGQTAPNPVLTTIKHYRREYDQHVRERHCPARKCQGLFQYEIDPEACTGCGVCRRNCPAEAITGERREPHVIDQDKCTSCGTCFIKCKFGAVLKV